MKPPFQSALADILKLTRQGDLKSATSAIQDMLGGRHPAQGPKSAVSEVIELRSAETRKPAEAGKPVGTFTQRSFGSSKGNLGYWLYVPAQAKPGMPLIVMLHGCTQSPEDFARGTGMNKLADEVGFLVAYPGQDRAANAQKCWNWFSPGHQKRDSGEPALIAGLTQQIIADEGVDPSRVYVAGLSAGGAAAAIMCATYPDIFAAAGIHSGLACGSATDLPSALKAMKAGAGKRGRTKAGRFVPVITFHGDRDTTVHEVNSGEIIENALIAAGGALKTVVNKGESGGRAYTQQMGIDPKGMTVVERWTVHDAGHAWSGGNASGSFADPAGPDASREMLRFFLAHRRVA